MPSESSPLLSNGNNNRRKASLISTSPNDPSILQSFRHLLFSSWINVLLVAVPLSFASHFAHWGSTATFIVSFLSIVPLAALLGECTEQCSVHLSESIGALLNATFGNAVEAIVGIIALHQGQLRIVQTSMLGSILSNILLVLGMSFFAAGFYRPESSFQTTAAQNSVSVLLLGMSTLLIPAAYHANTKSGAQPVLTLTEAVGITKDRSDLEGLLFISRGTSIILVVVYICYLYFQLKTHSFLFQSAEAAAEEGEDEDGGTTMSLTAAVLGLLAVTVLTSFCADYLVDSIDDFAERFSISKAFIGLILIPIVGNAAEHVTSVWMAAKGRMEITIGVSVGSSIQIAVGVIPVLVLIGWAIGQPLTLFFSNFETVVFFVSCIMVQNLLVDGKSNYMEGLMLMMLYVVIALSMWVS